MINNMSAVKIMDLEKNKILDAVQIAVEQKVGSRERILKSFEESALKVPPVYFTAEIDNNVVGIVGYYKDDGSWAGKSLGDLFPYGEHIYWVNFFAVSDKYTGSGIGSKLIKKLIDELKSLKAQELWTYTTRARIFYEKNGFEFVANSIIEGEPHDFLKMVF